MTSPKSIISVVIPCFNQGRFLLEAIDSVLASDFQDFEIIVVDDGSTEPETLAVLDSLNRPKTRLIRQVNRGLAGARQAGTEAARGRYFLPLDADDTIEPTYLRKAFEMLEADPKLGYVYCRMMLFGDENFIVRASEYNFYKLIWDCYIHASCLTRREAWLDAGDYATAVKNGYSDWALLISLGKAGWHGKLLPEVLFNYRRHAGAMTLGAVRRHGEKLRQLREFHKDIYGDRRRLAEIRKQWGDFTLKENLMRRAKRLTQGTWFPAAWRRALRRVAYASKSVDSGHAGQSTNSRLDGGGQPSFVAVCLSFFLLSLPFSGTNLWLQKATIDTVWKWPHVFLALSIISVGLLATRRRKLPFDIADLLPALFFMITFAGPLIGSWPANSQYYFGFARGLLIYATVVLTMRLGNFTWNMARLGLISVGVLAAALAFLQEIMVASLNRDLFMWSPVPVRLLVSFGGSHFHLLRATALTLDPNYFAILPAAAFLLCVIKLTKQPKTQAFPIILAGFTLLGVIFSLSRGGILALACGTAAALAFSCLIKVRRLVRPEIFAALVCVLIAGLIVTVIRNNAVYGVSSAVRRGHTVAAAVVEAPHVPIYGIGLGAYNHLDPYGSDTHNFFLEVYYAGGLLGSALWLVFMVMLASRLWFLRRKDVNAAMAGFALMALLVGFGLTLNLLTNMYFWTILGIISGSIAPRSKVLANLTSR